MAFSTAGIVAIVAGSIVAVSLILGLSIGLTSRHSEEEEQKTPTASAVSASTLRPISWTSSSGSFSSSPATFVISNATFSTPPAPMTTSSSSKAIPCTTRTIPLKTSRSTITSSSASTPWNTSSAPSTPWGTSSASSTPQSTSSVILSSTVAPPEKLHKSNVRLDCFPEPNARNDTCIKRGCFWNITTRIEGEPQCFYPTNYGYEINQVIEFRKVRLVKRRVAGEQEWISDPISSVDMTWEYLEGGTFHVKFVDSFKKRYEVPLQLWPEGKPKSILDWMSELQLWISNVGNFFDFHVIDKPTGRTLFNTSIGGFVFSDKFLQVSTYLPSDYLYGFGENVHQNFRHDLSFYQTWPMFARDQAPWSETLSRSNLYGVHPFYMCLTTGGTSFGVFFLNSNAQEYTTGPGPFVTYRAIGGILDIYLFRGPTPADVIAQYWKLIGNPMMPAYWSLGFHLSKYGYTGTEEIRKSVERMRESNIPQDVQYVDIDYMDKYMDFTIDPVHFGDLPQYVTETEYENLRWTFILDPAINAVVQNYKPFSEGKKADVFITWPNESLVPPVNDMYNNTRGTLLMLGTSWPHDNVVFPNFLDSKTNQWWLKQIEQFRTELEFDGLWIDMNEPSNFGTDKEVRWYHTDPHLKGIPPLVCPVNQWDDPPYATQAAYLYGETNKLANKTLCMTGKQGSYVHFDVHSLYGWSESKATLAAIQSVTDERGLVLSRSTYPSSGRYAGHWLGDNFSKWADMRTSIIGVLEFNLFGIPYVGADICGFYGNATEELCARWQQLGSFYPFSRNHNSNNSRLQDPAQWLTVANAARASLRNRYALLPYLYTLFYKAHSRSETVAQPLFFQFPHDSTTYDNDRQFMWGPAVLITPVLEQGKKTVEGYFPKGLWYNLYQEELWGMPVRSGFQTVTSALNESVPIHLRGGYTVVMQNPELNTADTRLNLLKFVIALDERNESRGELYWDDGHSISETKPYALLNFSFTMTLSSWSLKINLKEGGCNELFMPDISQLDVFSVDDLMKSVNGSVIVKVDSKWKKAKYSYYSETRRMQLKFETGVPLDLMFFKRTLTINWAKPNTTEVISETEEADCHPRPYLDNSKCESLGSI